MFIFIIVGVCAINPLEQLLDTWEEQIQAADVDTEIFQRVLTKLPEMPNTLLSRFYGIYGLYIFYGLEGLEGIDFARALYYFKRSSDLGNTEALFYVSLLTTLQLDGSFNILQNLKNQTDSILYQYVSQKHSSSSLVDLYFSAMQGNKKASISLAYRHLQGFGVDQNCSNAALFYLPVLEEFANSPNKAKYITSDKKVANMMYNGYFYSKFELGLRKTAATIQNPTLFNYEDIQQIYHLAYSYYYGLNGLPHNYKKAYNLYEILYQQFKSDPKIGLSLALMIIDGLGVENPDYKLAWKILNSLETGSQNKETLATVYNSIGYMYFKGFGTKKDIIKAEDYFSKSAELGDTNGLFNLGSLYLLPSTLERERNRKKGVALIEQAANKQHPMAQYSLALIFLDGVDLFYSCDLAAELLHAAATRGPWADIMNTASYLLQYEQRSQSLMRYLEAAYVGYPLGICKLIYNLENAAVLMEYKNAFYYDETHFINVQQRLEKDPVYDKSDDAFKYLYSDYLQFVNVSALQQLLKYDSHKLNGKIQYEFLKRCEKDPICGMKLGDYFYKGNYEEPNYVRAVKYYTKSMKSELIPSMKGHIYFNLGFMHALGLGLPENRTKAFEMFEQSITYYPLIAYIPQSIQVQVMAWGVNLYKQIQEVGINQILDSNIYEIAAEHLIEIGKDQLLTNAISIANLGLICLIVFVYGTRLRLINQHK